MQASFYFHDYETWGVDAKRDRPAQFAGIRTDEDLNIIGEPLVIYCKPPVDMLPRPEAVNVTGITPQYAQAHGLDERDFFRRINEEMSQPGTCSLGYNTLAFDDEVTRFGLWRNFMDPYAREWKNGNSRWDLIDVARLIHAVKPDGIEWPRHEDGRVSFRLEDLATANNLEQENAHDALSDVYATIALAKLFKERKPGLFAATFRYRGKLEATELLYGSDVVVEISRYINSEWGCISPVVPLLPRQHKMTSSVVFDLRYDPSVLLGLPREEIKSGLFDKESENLGVRRIQLNRCPVLLPYEKLPAASRTQWGIDAELVAERLAWVKAHAAELAALADYLFAGDMPAQPAEAALYTGFVDQVDRPLVEQFATVDSPDQAARLTERFRDPRLKQLALNLRARLWPDSLTTQEQAAYHARTARRLLKGEEGATVAFSEFSERLVEVSSEAREDRRQALADLGEWADALVQPYLMAEVEGSPKIA